MRDYLFAGASGQEGEVVVIEDKSMTSADEKGNPQPAFRFVDATTVRAHPAIIEMLIRNADPVWSLEDILTSIDEPAT